MNDTGLKNPDQLVKLRKYENTLIISGQAFIAFGMWSVVKIFLQTLLPNAQRTILLDGHEGNPLYLFMVLTIEVILCGFDIVFRIYIGKTAIAIGRGNHRKSMHFYLFLTSLAFLIELASIYEYLFFEAPLVDWNDRIATGFVLFSSFLCTTDLIVSAWKVRKYRREVG